MNTEKATPPLRKMKRVAALAMVCAAILIFATLFLMRDTVAPLHWSGLWLLLIALYIAAAISIRPEISIRFLGPLFPVLLIAALEFGWTVYDYASARLKHSTVAVPVGDAKLQSVIDFAYQPLTQQMEFIPDGIRMIKMPSNYRSGPVNTNSLGYRGPEFGPKPDGVFRIVMMGDSGLFGWNAPNDTSTIPAQLEKILNTHLGALARFEVLNLGVPSGVSNFHVPVFATYGQELDPDFLIMFLGLNDLGGSNVTMAQSFSQRLKRYVSLHTFSSQLKHFVREIASAFHLMAKRLHSYSALYQALFPPKKSWVGDNISAASQQASRFDIYAGVYLENLERIYRLSRKLNIDFATVEQPSMRLGLSLGTNLSPLDRERKEGFMNNFAGAWRDGTEKYESVVRLGDQLARRYGGVHLGLSNIFAQHQGPMVQGRFVGQPPNAIFVTDAHYSGYGLNLIANQIFIQLEARLRKSVAARAGGSLAE